MLQARDLARGVRTVARMRVPIASTRATPGRGRTWPRPCAVRWPTRGAGSSGPPRRRRGSAAQDDATIADLRRRLSAHPCHGCSEREDHARWAERHHRLAQEHAALVRRIEGRTSSIARVFDTVCEVLAGTGYLRAGGGAGASWS